MQKRILYTLATLLLLTACNTNTPSALSVKGKIYKHPTAVQYLKFKADSVLYYGNFGNETLNNHTFAYTQKDEVVTIFTPTPEHLLAYEGFIQRGNIIYEQVANTSDPNYQDHQPANPATFSLVGKRYATILDTDNLSDTLEFMNDSIVAEYTLKRHTHFAYQLDYPHIKFIYENEIDYSYGLFADTTTLRWQGDDYFIIK